MKRQTPNPYAVLPALISPTPGFLETRFSFKHKRRTARPSSRAHSIDLMEGSVQTQYDICRKQLDGLQRDYEAVRSANEKLQSKLGQNESKPSVLSLREEARVDKELADASEDLQMQLSSALSTLHSLLQTAKELREKWASVQRELGHQKYQEELGDAKQSTVIHLVTDTQLEEALAAKTNEVRTTFKDIASLKGKTHELEETNCHLAKEREELLTKASSLQSLCSEEVISASELQRQLRIAEEELRLAQDRALRAEQSLATTKKRR